MSTGTSVLKLRHSNNSSTSSKKEFVIANPRNKETLYAVAVRRVINFLYLVWMVVAVKFVDFFEMITGERRKAEQKLEQELIKSKKMCARLQKEVSVLSQVCSNSLREVEKESKSTQASFENPFKVPKVSVEDLTQQVCLQQTFSQLTNLHGQLESLRDGLLEQRKTALENRIRELEGNKKSM